MYDKIKWYLCQYTSNSSIYNNCIMQSTLIILGLTIIFGTMY